MRRTAVLAGLLVASLVALGLVRASAAGPSLMDGWYVYDYRAGLDVTPAVNVFEPAVEHDGAVWANHRQWSIDDPESPPSVLALVRYEEWSTASGTVEANASGGPDLRGGCVAFEVRGEGLDLHGGTLDFWVMSSAVKQRWHTDPIPVSDEWERVELRLDEVGWRNSWQGFPDVAPDLERTLSSANSWGLGFVGFDAEPTGMLGLRGFDFC